MLCSRSLVAALAAALMLLPATVSAQGAAPKAADGAKKAGDAAKKAGDAAKKAGDTAKKAGDTAKKAGDTAKKAGDTAKKAGDTAKKAGDTAKKAGDSAKAKAADAKNDATKKATEAVKPASAPATKAPAAVKAKLPKAKPLAPRKPAPKALKKVKAAPKKAKATPKKAKKRKGPVFFESRAKKTAPISTDRPGNTDAATTVEVLHLQIETGVLWTKATVNDRSFKTFRFPTSLRLGILNWLEIRLRSDIVGVQSREGEDTDAGGTDTVFGFRARLLEGRNFYIPTVAMQFELGIPTGSDEFTNDAVVPELQFNANFDLPAGIWLALNTDIDAINDVSDNEIFWRWGGVVQLGFRPQAFDKIGIYVDLSTKLALDRDRDDSDILLFSGGVAYRLTHDAQVDLWAQTGLTDSSADFGIGGGFSYRL